jgi:predicted ribosomally synthesized peptide with SipW-like signal peptide
MNDCQLRIQQKSYQHTICNWASRIPLLLISMAAAAFLISWLHIPATYSYFTDSDTSNVLSIQAGVMDIIDDDVEAAVTDPNPENGKHYNIQSNNPVQVEIRSIRGCSLEDVLPDSVELGYMGDTVHAAVYRFHQDILILTFNDVSSVLAGKLTGGKSEINITITGELQNGIRFNKKCPLLVHVPPGSIKAD